MSNKQFLYIVIATFITATIWVVFDIIHSRAQVKPPPKIEQLLEPLNPEFDQEALDLLDTLQ